MFTPALSTKQKYKGCKLSATNLIKKYIQTIQSFGGRPSVFVTAKYTRDTKSKDAMYIWLENVNSGSFEVCIREFLPFDGKHQDTIVVGNMSSSFLFHFKFLLPV